MSTLVKVDIPVDVISPVTEPVRLPENVVAEIVEPE